MSADKVTGPASYFPSIEKKYGQPISHWKSLLAAMPEAKHSEMVAMLKSTMRWGTAMPLRSLRTIGRSTVSDRMNRPTGRQA